MSTVQAEVTALITRYVGYSETMDFAGKKALWDHDDPSPLLMPEEAPAPLIGWQAIDSYWSKSRVVMETLKSTTANHTVRQVEDSLVLATYDMRWVATMAGPKDVTRAPISADVRVTALLRKKTDGWRFFHLMEGPVDLMAMTRLAYERNARTLFPDQSGAP